MAGDVLVNRLGDVRGQRNVAELPGDPELQRPELSDRADLLPDAQGGVPVYAAAGPDCECLADPRLRHAGGGEADPSGTPRLGSMRDCQAVAADRRLASP
jgi:hypothetical protein